MLPFAWRTSTTALLVLINTFLCLSLPVHSFPLAKIYHRSQHSTTNTVTRKLTVRTAGPTHAGIITHPPAQLQQAIFGIEKPAARFLEQSGRWTRGGLEESTYSALDQFLVSNDKATSYFYTISIVGLGLHDHPDGLWKFQLRVDLAVDTEKNAQGHTKLPQLTASYLAPHPAREDSYVAGDLLDIYELSEKDILETIQSEEPAVGVMNFLSSKVSRMPGFWHKHVGIEEFELYYPRTRIAAGHA